MVGAGALAPHLVRAHAVVRPIRNVLLWNRSPEGAETLRGKLEDEFESVRVVTDLDEASREADIISTATLSRSPLIFGRQFRPGTHLDLVGAFTPEMAEADPGCFRGSYVAVDSREGAGQEAGDLLQAIDAGAFRFGEIACDLHELVRRTAPPPPPDAITVFKSVGAALEDLAAALLAVERSSLES
jgi:ornithine cyclodeaminase